ncbi:hypothetical protein ABIE91_008499 [Bradyrhizobium elkanii]
MTPAVCAAKRVPTDMDDPNTSHLRKASVRSNHLTAHALPPSLFKLRRTSRSHQSVKVTAEKNLVLPYNYAALDAVGVVASQLPQ